MKILVNNEQMFKLYFVFNLLYSIVKHLWQVMSCTLDFLSKDLSWHALNSVCMKILIIYSGLYII